MMWWYNIKYHDLPSTWGASLEKIASFTKGAQQVNSIGVGGKTRELASRGGREGRVKVTRVTRGP